MDCTMIINCIDDDLVFDIIPYICKDEQLLYIITNYPSETVMRKSLWNCTLKISINDYKHTYHRYCCLNKSCFVLILNMLRHKTDKFFNIKISFNTYSFFKSIINATQINSKKDNILCTFDTVSSKIIKNSELCIYTQDSSKYTGLNTAIIVQSKKLNMLSAQLHAKLLFRNYKSTIIDFNQQYKLPLNKIILNENKHNYNIIPNNFRYGDVDIIYDIFTSPVDQYLYIICPNIKTHLRQKYNKSFDNIQIIINNKHYSPTKIFDKSTRLLIIEEKFIDPIVTITLGNITKTYKIDQNSNHYDKMIMSTIFKDENNLIDSWIKYHKKLGFDLFVLYNNNPNNKSYYTELIARYPNQIIFIDWGYPYELFESGISAQTTQQTHTLLKYRDAKYVALMDLDEYIVSLNAPFLKFLNDFDNVYEDISAFTIETLWFGCGKKCDYSKEDDKANFIDKMLYRNIITTGPLQHQKAIVNPKNVTLFNIHEPSVYNGMYIFINPNVIRMNHYYTLSSKKRICDCSINDAMYDDKIFTI